MSFVGVKDSDSTEKAIVFFFRLIDCFSEIRLLACLTCLPALKSLESLNSLDLSQHGLQMDIPIDTDNPLAHSPYLENQSISQEPARVSAYAKLIFEDGYFYMNTYSVILGRDLKAWHSAMRNEKRRQKQIQEGGDCAGDLETPVRSKHEGSRYSRSIVSESGGMLRAGNDSDEAVPVDPATFRPSDRKSVV